jgi:hypothetical protein
MGIADYRVVSKGNGWSVLHDGAAANEYASKEAGSNLRSPRLPSH